ncbi:hypothetical protein J6590_056218 [Homalodisca vitripennis]|nr:hypothetical protein J6590_056218 [Homalodisca vitripennis]
MYLGGAEEISPRALLVLKPSEYDYPVNSSSKETRESDIRSQAGTVDPLSTP